MVTGIRGSLQQSLDRKRNADNFVDAITAEDIGAFPDQNLAESLQRIAGVAIDRKLGEGSLVSVRGLGPDFVQVTTNGAAAENFGSTTFAYDSGSGFTAKVSGWAHYSTYHGPGWNCNSEYSCVDNMKMEISGLTPDAMYRWKIWGYNTDWDETYTATADVLANGIVVGNAQFP